MTHLSLATSTTLFGNTVLQQLVVCEQALTERPRELAKFFAPCKSSLDTTHTIASPQTSFGVRSSRIHFDEQTPKEVCGEPTHTREAHCIYYATRVWEELLWQQGTDVVTQKLYLVDSPYIDLLSEETPCSLTQLHASHNWISAF